MFGIGEFSKITGLTVKTLRFYHERGILVPAQVDSATGYRYYDHRNADAARTITALREYGFGLDDVAEILRNHTDEADIVDFLDKRKEELAGRIERDRGLVSRLERVIQQETQAREIAKRAATEIVEKTLPPIVAAGIQMRGRYESCGHGFAKLGRCLGRHVSGPPFCLYYDAEYREDDATFEPCVPLRRTLSVAGIQFRELAGGPCISLIHRGPYDQLGRSYERLLRLAKERDYKMSLPSREVYLKGPGMILRGNPKNYLTEIQIMIESG